MPAYKIGSYMFWCLSQHKVIYVLYIGTALISKASVIFRDLQIEALSTIEETSMALIQAYVAGMSSVAIGD